MIVNVLIFLLGLTVYAGYGWTGLVWLLGLALLTYGCARLQKRLPWLSWVSVAASAAVLVLFKCQHLVGLSLLAPLGVSYFTLRLIAYTVDIRRGKYEPERNLFRFLLNITYLPHLSMGPIESYDKLDAALFEDRRITWDGLSIGAVRVLWGLFKKLVIASRAGVIVSAIAGDTAQYRGGFALAAMVLYWIQLYCDFSGGMDMVLGFSRMLGIRLSENFDAPFLAESFQEFWRRWHITLGAWLRNYVYIPLGGNRKGKARKFLNLVITFLVSGFWHGFHYLLWGAVNGVFVSLGQRLQTKCKILNRVVTFLLVSMLWSFFIWPDTLTAMKMILSLFTTFNYGTLLSGIGAMGLTVGDWIVLGVAVAALLVCDAYRASIGEKLKGFGPAARLALCGAIGMLVLVFGMYGLGFNAGEFIYSRF